MTKNKPSEINIEIIKTAEALGARGQLVNHALFGNTGLQTDPAIQKLIKNELAARKQTHAAPLSDDIADAIRQFVRILSRDAGPDERINLIRSAEKFIKNGKLPNIRPHQLAVLFYPNNKAEADKLSEAVNIALSEGELPYMADDGGPMLTPDCLVAWPDCLLVPLDSPLRFWLPEFTHATVEEATCAKNDAPQPHDDTVLVTTGINEQDLAELFDPVHYTALEAMFPAGGNWQQFSERAPRNGLDKAKVGRARFNPMLAALWWVENQKPGWTLERVYRKLANNLPPRSKGNEHLLTGDYD